MRAEQKSRQEQVLGYFHAMHGCYAAMPESDRHALHEWEAVQFSELAYPGTSKWPGWEKYIGPFPTWDDEHRSMARIKKTIANSLRWRIYERDGFQCLLCHARTDLSLDHRIPECRGGPTTFDNLRTLCRTCNGIKGPR
jgi:hypothetical protein